MKRLRNTFERTIEKQLKKAKVNFRYEDEKIPYVLARHYIPDFILYTSSGKLYIETKGHLRREDKAKLVAVKKQHPEMDLRIVFYSRSKMNERWATRHGFRFAYCTIPEEWLHGL